MVLPRIDVYNNYGSALREVLLTKGSITGISHDENVQLLEFDSEDVAIELFVAMIKNMDMLEINQVSTTDSDGTEHYYVGNSQASHETAVGGYLFINRKETIDVMTHFHPTNSQPSSVDKYNASHVYRNINKYSWANPNCILYVTYRDQQLETIGRNYY